MWQISIKDVENIRIGQAENLSAGTGCTVVICDRGAPTGLDIRGGGPATRETGLLSRLASADKIHAIGNVQNFSHIEWLNRLDASLSRVHRKFSC